MWGYRPVYPHGSTWAAPDKVAQLLGEPCGASRDYLIIKETKSVRIDIVSSADTIVIIG
jgi:hypothetical protein